MAYIQLPLGIKVALEFTLLGKAVVNVYHVTTTDPIITVKLVDIAQVFRVWWSTSMANNLAPDIELHAITALNLDVPNGEKITLAVTPPDLGLLIQPVVSNNVAIVTTLKTAKTGRSFQGRSYLCGISEDELIGNNLSAARVASILASWPVLDSSLAANNATLVVASFFSEQAPREVGVATPVDSFVMNDRCDTQRRRLPKA